MPWLLRDVSGCFRIQSAAFVFPSNMRPASLFAVLLHYYPNTIEGVIGRRLVTISLLATRLYIISSVISLSTAGSLVSYGNKIVLPGVTICGGWKFIILGKMTVFAYLVIFIVMQHLYTIHTVLKHQNWYQLLPFRKWLSKPKYIKYTWILMLHDNVIAIPH